MFSDATLLGLVIAGTAAIVITLGAVLLNTPGRTRARRLRDLQHARDAAEALACEAHDSAAAERARRYTARIPTNPHHRPEHDASVRGWDGATAAAFGFNATEAAILTARQAATAADRQTADRRDAGTDGLDHARADAARLTAAHAAAQAALDPATVAHMQAGDHLIWGSPAGPTVTRLDAADAITPALERRLRQMMRDEIARARAREMGGG